MKKIVFVPVYQYVIVLRAINEALCRHTTAGSNGVSLSFIYLLYKYSLETMSLVGNYLSTSSLDLINTKILRFTNSLGI